MLYDLWILALLGGAAVRDLRTGYVEDVFAASIAGTGLLVHGYASVASGTAIPVVAAVVVGCLCLGVGWYATRLELWGEGDALLLGALGVAYPEFQLLLIGSVGATSLIYVYTWKMVAGSDSVRLVPAFPVALMPLVLLFG